ncbi:MAG: TIR domain-containing protein [Sporolactobacillus sp.]
MSDKVFVSYHSSDEGTRYKNLLVAWSKNDNGYFDLKFDDLSIGVSINSDNATYIKSKIKRRIEDCKTFVALIDADYSDSDWCKWEDEKAVELGKKIVVVKISNTYTTPTELLGVGAKFAMSFTYDAIKKAIDD